MSNSNESAIRNACRTLLRPVAAMMLKCGMTWKEFSDLSKSAFVESATRDYGIQGRPTNVSRVSILTGISRKEVKRQRDLAAAERPAAREKTTDATRLLSGWHQDPDYLDTNSEPALLPERGPAPSFESLCVQYGGDIPVTALLKELLKTNAVGRVDDGQLQALSRYYQPAVHDDENLRFAVSRITELTETMINNVFPDDMHVPRFGGYAANDSIEPAIVPEFNKFLDERGQAFLEEIDDWLTKHAADDNARTKERVRVGIGLYAVEDKQTLENSS
jgi:Family of unknown function (DUF6502)